MFDTNDKLLITTILKKYTKYIKDCMKKTLEYKLIFNPESTTEIMAIKNDIHIFNAIKTANGSYFNSGASDYFGSKFDYGQHVGTYVSVNYAGKYLILRDGKYYFVDGKSVKTY